jgi:hypothetical protein
MTKPLKTGALFEASRHNSKLSNLYTSTGRPGMPERRSHVVQISTGKAF